MIKWCLQKNPSERADMLSLVQQNYIFPHFHSYGWYSASAAACMNEG